MNERKNSPEGVYVDSLTWREQEVLILLSERLTNREIAESLYISESTVKDYVHRILSKLYVKNRREAVRRAEQLGILDRDQVTVIKPPVNLPAEPTPFVGRKDELLEIQQYLQDTRLLTLTGPGGMGKTRLALRTAAEIADEFEHGCFFISLAPLRSVDHLIQTIAEGVKFPLAKHEDPQLQLLHYLRNRQLLLLMDNFEHLLDGANVISKMLQAAPGLKILATSRERLNLQSETFLVVSGMDHSGQVASEDPLNYDAVNLFVQSARKVRSGYDPSPAELEQIAKICKIVQGMPLAIELAAAWLYILNVDEIVKELETGLDILATEVRDAPERHRSIRNVFNHSWSMLDQNEREIFMRLSVFLGGFSRDAAQQVAGASFQQLTGLVNKSFLNHDPDSNRLEVHELLRQYAQEQLQRTPQVGLSAQEEHAAYYAEFMQQRWADLKGHRQLLALAEIEADIENVRAAWRFYLDQRNAPKMQMFTNSFREVYWFQGWNHSGMELFADAARALKGLRDDESITLRALAMAWQGYFMAWLGLADQGYELAIESVEILGKLNNPEALAFAYESLSLNSYCLNRFIEETIGKDKLRKISVELDDKWMIALSLFESSMVALRVEDYSEAEQLAESCLNLCNEIGNVIRSTLPLLTLGHTAQARGEYEKANNYYLRILKISQETGFLWGIEKSSKYLGKAALSMDNLAAAETYLLQSLRITNEIGYFADVLNLLFDYASLLVAKGHKKQAVELLVLVLQHPISYQLRLGEGRIRDSAKGLLFKLKNDLVPEIYSTALERGRELEMDEVINKLVNPESRSGRGSHSTPTNLPRE